MDIQGYYLYVGTPLMGGAVTFAVGAALHYGSEFYRSFKERKAPYQLKFDFDKIGNVELRKMR